MTMFCGVAGLEPDGIDHRVRGGRDQRQRRRQPVDPRQKHRGRSRREDAGEDRHGAGGQHPRHDGAIAGAGHDRVDSTLHGVVEGSPGSRSESDSGRRGEKDVERHHPRHGEEHAHHRGEDDGGHDLGLAHLDIGHEIPPERSRRPGLSYSGVGHRQAPRTPAPGERPDTRRSRADHGQVPVPGDDRARGPAASREAVAGGCGDGVPTLRKPGHDRRPRTVVHGDQRKEQKRRAGIMGDGYAKRQLKPHVRRPEHRLDDEQHERGAGRDHEPPMRPAPPHRHPAEHSQIRDGDERADSMHELDGDARIPGQHPPFESGVRLLPRPEAGRIVPHRPPVSVAGGEVRARERRIVGAGPAPERNLNGEDRHPDRGGGPELRRQRRIRRSGGTEVDSPQQTENGHSPEQVSHNDRRLQPQGNRPCPEGSLKHDQSHEHDGECDRPALCPPPPVANRGDGEDQDPDPEHPRSVPVHHLAPRLSPTDGGGERSSLRTDGQPPVAAGPVRTSEPRTSEPHPGAEHHHREGKPGHPERQAADAPPPHQPAPPLQDRCREPPLRLLLH